MTARHSPLFSLSPGQSGLGIYTTQRDAAERLQRCSEPFRVQARAKAIQPQPCRFQPHGRRHGKVNVLVGLSNLFMARHELLCKT